MRKQLQVEGEGYEEESREGDGEPGQGALQAHRGPHVSTCLRSRVIGDPAEPPALHLQELMKMKMMSIPTLLPWGCSRPSPCQPLNGRRINRGDDPSSSPPAGRMLTVEKVMVNPTWPRLVLWGVVGRGHLPAPG